MPNEFDFIDWLRNQAGPSSILKLGIGDDLAALRWGAGDLLLVGVDQVLDGVHFNSAVHDPRSIGRKAMNRNLSDCAAMACLPAAAVVSVALPRGIGDDYARELYLGLREAADPFDCPIVGGDTGSWPGKLAMSVTILGRSAGIPPVTRSGARPGDRIYVSGPLGGSISGRHMSFLPRVELARTIARSSKISAMIDLSDGLARDLLHILRQSRVGANLIKTKIPIHDDARRLNGDPFLHAIGDGEDYELLLTSPEDLSRFGLTEIGYIVDGSKLIVEDDRASVEMPLGGWEHTL